MKKKTDQEIIDEVIRIEFAIRKLMSGLNLGLKNSKFKGHGMTFSDIRHYEPGDDIRNFAWQVMARTGEPFVKQFEEERDLEVHLAADIGPTFDFGGLKKTKYLMQAYLIAFLGLSTSKSRDKFGGIIYNSAQVKRVPAKRGDNHVRQFLFSYLEEFENHKKRISNPNIALDYFSKIKAKNSFCILISDFASPIDQKLLARVKSKHKLLVIHVYDPYELEFPDVGWLRSDLSLWSKPFLWFNSKTVNNQLSASYNDKVTKLRRLTKTYGIDFVEQSTHDEGLREITKSLNLRSVYG